MKEKLKKILCLSSSALLLSNQFFAVGYAASKDEVDLFQPVDRADLQTLEKYADSTAKDFLSSNLLHKGYSLNAYEAVVLSVLIEKQLSSNKNMPASDKQALLEIQNKLKPVYRKIMKKNPKAVSGSSKKASSSPSYLPFGDISDAGTDDADDAAGKTDNAASAQAPAPQEPTVRDKDIKQYQSDIADAKTPEELATAMSVINIKAHPSAEDGDDQQDDDVSPLSDFMSGGAGKLSELEDSENTDNFEPWKYDEFASLAEDYLTTKTKEERRFYMQAYHNLRYVKQTASGHVPLDTSVVDENGNYYQPEATNQYELEDSIDIGFGLRVHKALDLLFAVTAKNEDGIVGRPGTKLEFSNVLFKFHPERLQSNKSKLRVRLDGSVVSTNIPGTDAGVSVNTDNGGIGVSVNGTEIGYDDTNGVTFVKDGVNYTNGMNQIGKMFGKYFIGIGKLSIDFSSYTLQLSDCKAVELGYKDGMEGLTFVYAKPQSKEEGSDDAKNPQKGTFDRFLYAAQYTTKRLIPSMDLAFNFAKASDKGSLLHPGGATKTDSMVYGISFRSNGKLARTEFEGELARSINTYGVGTSKSSRVSGNADYLDLTHTFSKYLSGTLHLVNIDGSFDASSMVEDNTGDYLLTDNNGDGKPDYLYESGQRGMDLSLAYRFPNEMNLAFGLSRYSLYTNGSSYTDIYLAGSKSWELANGGTFGIQQRFEHRKSSSQPWTNNSSNTTLSLENMQPWKDAEVSSHLQVTRDKVEGNDRRFDLSVAQNFYPLERVTVTPRFEYSSKKGEVGLDKEAAEDSTTIINSLAIGYEVVPDELTVNLLVSKEKYDIISADIDESTGRNTDGERRNVFGKGIGLVWKPKHIAGLEAALSYRRDRVHYFEPKDDWSSQDVWDTKFSYSKNVGKMLQASLSYDYHSAKDHIKPIYDEVTRTVELNLDAVLSSDSYIRLSHSYSKYYSPLQASNNYTEQTTTISMSNKF